MEIIIRNKDTKEKIQIEYIECGHHHTLYIDENY